MATDQKLSQLIQRAPDGTEFVEVIIPPFTPGTNRKVLLSDLVALADPYTTPFPRVDITGTTAYTGTLSPAITAYTNGMKVHVKAKDTSTGGVTLNLNAVGVKQVWKNPTTQASTGDLLDEQGYIFEYDSALNAGAGVFLMLGENSATVPDADASTKGIAKLYTALGANTDGAIDQNTANANFGLKAPLASPTFTGTPAAPTAAVGTNTTQLATTEFVNQNRELVVAFSDKTTPITSGTDKENFPAPSTRTILEIWVFLGTVQASGSIFTVDVNVNGSTMLSTKITVDNTESTSLTAVAAAVISNGAWTKGDKISIDVDQVGNGTALAGKIIFRG